MRRIDTSAIPPVAPPSNLGPAPDLRWIDIAALRVDPRYQREIGRHNIAHIRKIAGAFDWRMFSVVVVSPVPGGVFAIVDGQHRTTAAALCGIESVPCQVIQADAAMQARAFEAINGSTIKVTPQQRFKAAIAAGDAQATRIHELATRARVKILGSIPSTHNVTPGDCIAILALQRLAATFDDEHCVLILECLRLMVTRPKILMRSDMIEAAIDAFRDRPAWLTHPGIKACFASIDQERAYQSCRELAAREDGLKIRDCLCALFFEEIDEELAKGKVA
jgi:hypothetical protein